MLMQQEQQESQLMRFLHWIRMLLASVDFQAIEAQAWLFACMIGLVFLNPFTGTFAAGRGFAVMEALAPEWAWGLILFWIGCIGLLAMWNQSVKWRRGMLFLIACLWACMAFTFYISNSNGLGAWLFGGLALSAGWAYWRIAYRSV